LLPKCAIGPKIEKVKVTSSLKISEGVKKEEEEEEKQKHGEKR
jgi:hypothetical protein